MSFLSLTACAANDAPKIPCTESPSDDEREHDPEQAERLDQPDTDEHDASDLTRVLGLPSHGFDGLAHQDPDPDAWPNRSQAVDEALPDCLEPRVGDRGHQRVHHDSQHVNPP